jgi:hypothetical protein
MQPERHIEKLLEAFAQKRRDQARAGFELHPATRQMLQGEVARQFRRPVGKGAPWWQSWFGPRLVFATGTLAALVVLALLLFPPAAERPGPTLTLVKQEPAMPVDELKALSPLATSPPMPLAVAPGGIPQQQNTADADAASARVRRVFEAPDQSGATYALAQNEPAMDKSKLGFDSVAAANRGVSPSRELQPPLTPAAAPASAPLLRKSDSVEDRVAAATFGSEYRAPTGGLRTETNPAAELSLAEKRPEVMVRGGGATGSTGLLAEKSNASDAKLALAENGSLGRQYFRTEPATSAPRLAGKDIAGALGGAKPSAVLPVLASFQFEQRGTEIRVVDADGSVYVGTAQQTAEALPMAAVDSRRMQTQVSPRAKGTSAGVTKPQAGVPMASAQPTVNFIVRGTNTTLRQAVVFTGNLQRKALIPQGPASNPAASIAARFQNQTPVPNQRLNSQLNGRARLANGAEVEINAVALPQVPARTP